ncbi:MAG: TonB family protein [Burkholderiaceae bacterium]|nr:TonB family protein [Burkholderiaceae bacterium]
MKPFPFLRSVRTLHLALGVSIAVHAVLLTVRFVDPEGFNRMFRDTPLEVVLVNARSNDAPDKAQVLAQTSLAGGGEARQGRASSPLPHAGPTSVGSDIEDAQRQLEALQAQQDQLLTQLRQQIAALPVPEARPTQEQGEQSQQEEKRRQLVKLLAEIEKRINEENATPRKRYISPATREAAYAIYYSALRNKVEDKGTAHFPEQGGKKLYGELIMIITVNHDGRVLDTEVVQSSGNPALDRRAQAIARSAGPFGAFTRDMRRQADQIAMVARFKFTREQTLETGG